jgi:hypothetical protein
MRGFMTRMLGLIAASRWLATLVVTVALAACGSVGVSSSSAAASQSGASVDSTDSRPPAASQSNLPAPSVGDVTLSWDAPDENTDGSALTNLTGYRIYYGASADDLSQVIEIPGVGVTTYVVDDLATGTYYFSIRAYNAQGVESASSNIVSGTIG